MAKSRNKVIGLRVRNNLKTDMWLMALVACTAIVAIAMMSKGITLGKLNYSRSPITGGVAMSLSNRCYDSDGGLNYYDAGSISGRMPRNFDAYDKCISKTILQETYCNNNRGAAVQFACPYGCEAGRCKPE